MSDQSNYARYTATKPPFLKRKRVQVVTAGVAGLLLGAALGGGSASSAPTAKGVSEAQVQSRIAAAVDNALETEQAAGQSDLTQSKAALDETNDLLDETKTALDESKAALLETAAALDESRSRVSGTKQKLKKANREIRQVRANAKVSQRRAVAAAVAQTKSQMQQAQANEPRSLTGGAGGGGSTDPQFDWCYEANDAGYGNYQQGVDPEYDWYDDADSDGWVCEF